MPHDQAIAFQARANAINEYNLTLNLSVGSERQKLAYVARLSEQMNGAVLLHIGFAPGNSSARDLAVTSILQSKGRVQDALSNSLAALHRRSDERDKELLNELNRVSARLAQLTLNVSPGTSVADQKSIKTWEDQREKLESDISNRSAEFRSQHQPLTLDAVRRLLPDGAALVEFAIFRPTKPKASSSHGSQNEPHYVAYVIRAQGQVDWADLGPATTIDDAVRELRSALSDPRRKDVEVLARRADEKLMRPLRTFLADTRQLLLSPEGQLNVIPFAALVDETGHYLIERYSFSYLTSGRDLLRMRIARESRSKPIVVANPAFDATGSASHARTPTASIARSRSVTNTRSMSEVYFAPLGGTAEEAVPIQRLLAAELLTGTAATESAIKRTVAPQVLHLATHGFFLQDESAESDGSKSPFRSTSVSVQVDNPLLRSGLAFAGANSRDARLDDGILTALEASGLNLWGTKLVVLSACDTGLGEIRNGEGVYGLRRAFVLAGAESLLMSLWPVSDYPTRRLMTGYYENLVTRRLGRGEALREVQLSMIKEKRHPFFWANFIQSGEWGSLDGKR